MFDRTGSPVQDHLLLAVPSCEGGPTILRVTVPEGLSREDVYLSLIAEIPAAAPQPVALNIGRSVVG